MLTWDKNPEYHKFGAQQCFCYLLMFIMTITHMRKRYLILENTSNLFDTMHEISLHLTQYRRERYYGRKKIALR